MSETITLNGVDRSSVIQRKNLELAENAYLGEVATGRAQIDDAAGTITVPGYKSATVEQSSSTPSRIFSGFTHRKGIRRGETYTTGAGREYDVTLVDGNDLLRRLIIRQRDGDSAAEGGKRPAETVGERVTWLLASGFLAASDFGAVTYPDVGMTKTDYRNSNYPGDVLAACAKAVRFNYYVRWNVAEADWELVFRDDNASTDDTCTLSISNDPSEVDEDTVFAPFEEAELAQDPEDVYSGAIANHGKGSVYAHRAATATAFVERDGVTEDSGTTTDATASRDAETFLYESKDEEQILPVTLRLNAAKVGLIQAGMRIPVHMTHMDPEGWGNALDDDPRYARILRLRRTQPLNTDFDYDVSMDLSPQEAGPPAAAIVQMAFARGTAFGLEVPLPNPVTIGNTLVCIITTKLDADPETPNINASLPRWGAGAWTRFNGTTKTAGQADHYGVSAWYKTADSTQSNGYISEQNPHVAVFEIAGADPGSATIADQDETVGGPNYDIGTLTPAAGDVAIAAWAMAPLPSPPATQEWAWDYSNSYAWQTPNPNPGISAGWTLDWSRWNGEGYSLDAFLPSSPWTVYAHAYGDGSSLLARVTPGESGHPFGGLYIVIPPA